MKPFAKSPPDKAHEPLRVAVDESGDWTYEGTEISAVGARVVTLEEVMNPRFIARAGEEPEAALFSLAELEADKELLHWAFKEGKRIDGDAEPEYKVPFAIWQEHAGDPVGAWLPERDGSGVDRSLALLERKYRFAKQALDDIGVMRQYLIVLASRLGRSRRAVGETLGLSTARIQQLSEAPSDHLLAEVDEFLETATQVSSTMGPGVHRRDDLRRPDALGSDEFEEVVAVMISVGLAEEMGEDLLRLTKDGIELVADERRRGHDTAKRVSDRERASSASR